MLSPPWLMGAAALPQSKLAVMAAVLQPGCGCLSTLAALLSDLLLDCSCSEKEHISVLDARPAWPLTVSTLPCRSF